MSGVLLFGTIIRLDMLHILQYIAKNAPFKGFFESIKSIIGKGMVILWLFTIEVNNIPNYLS